MKKVLVDADNGRYDIVIGNRIISDEPLKRYTDYAVITDDIVYPLLHEYFPEAKWIILPAGESSKSMRNLEMIYQK